MTLIRTQPGSVTTPSLTGLVLATGGGQEALKAHGNIGAAETFNLADGNVHTATITANSTFTFSGAASGYACSWTLVLTQDGTGGRTVTWPASVKWAGGTAPTLSTGAFYVDLFVFLTTNGGTVWWSNLVGNHFS